MARTALACFRRWGPIDSRAVTGRHNMKDLEGKQRRYLIGGNDNHPGKDDEIIEFSFDAEEPPKRGIGVKYCNLFNEKYGDQKKAEREAYGPYLRSSDTAKKYNE